MFVQEAAHRILSEFGKPLSSKELARIMLEREMVRSGAQDPGQSFAQTIEKNIRSETYNNPKLIFIDGPHGRLIGFPEWEATPPKPMNSSPPHFVELKIKIPIGLFEKIRLAEHAKLKSDFNETITMLLSKGVSLVASDIKKGLMQQLESL